MSGRRSQGKPSVSRAEVSRPSKAPVVELVTIGNELLAGSTVDGNAAHIAGRLREIGLEPSRKTTVGDHAGRIAELLREVLDRADIVLTTGGLGPTADDPTREAVALAYDRPLEFRPELWAQIEAMFERFGVDPSPNNRQQAMLPRGAEAIPNPVGTAPAFRVEDPRGSLIALPGVPREMEHLLNSPILPWLRRRFGQNGVLRTRVLRTAGLGESRIDERLRDLALPDAIELGLAAHAGQVDLRLAIRAESDAAAEAALAPLESEIRDRLDRWIFGSDEQTLAGAILERLGRRGWSLTSLECGSAGRLASALCAEPGAADRLLGCQVHPAPLEAPALESALASMRQASGADVALGLSISESDDRTVAGVSLLAPDGSWQRSIPQGGHPALVAERASMQALALVWRRL